MALHLYKAATSLSITANDFWSKGDRYERGSIVFTINTYIIIYMMLCNNYSGVLDIKAIVSVLLNSTM